MTDSKAMVGRLRDDVKQLRKMTDACVFAGDETGVRVKNPAILLADLDEAATLIEEQRREIERRDDFQPLLDAYIAATYCLNRYRHLHAGRSVRDLDEAEERLRICATKLDAWASLAPPPRTESAGCDSGKSAESKHSPSKREG